MHTSVLQKLPDTTKPDFVANYFARVCAISGRITFYTPGLVKTSYLSQPESEQKNIPLNRRKRGASGLPRKGKELLREGLYLLWHLAMAEKLKLVFWTITIPTHYEDGTLISTEDYKRLLKRWPHLVKRIFEELSRLYERAGLPNRFLYVVEPHEKRSRDAGMPIFHIHAVMVNRWNKRKRNPQKDLGYQNSGNWDITIEQTDEIVQRTISNELGKTVDTRAACQVENITQFSKMASYLRKTGKIANYITKGSKVLQEMAEAGHEDLFPPNWYGCDRQTRRAVRDSIVTIDLGETTLGDIHEGLQRFSLEHQFEHDRPLFSNFYWVQPEGCDAPVALVTGVYRRQDIEAALDVLPIFDRDIAPKSGLTLIVSAASPVEEVKCDRIYRDVAIAH